MTAPTTRIPPLGVTGPRALAWPVWLFGAIAPLLILSLTGRFTSPVAAAVNVVIVATVSAALVLVPGWLVLPRVKGVVARRVLIYTCYAVASLGSSLGISANMFVSGAVPSFPWIQVINGFIFFMWFLIVVGLYVNDRFEFRLALARLSALRAQLVFVSEWRESQLGPTVRGLRDRIHHDLAALLSAIGTNATGPTKPSGLTDTIIRPLLSDIDALQVGSHPTHVGPTREERRRSFRDIVSVAVSGTREFVLPTSLFIATTWLVTGLSEEKWVLAPIFMIVAGAIAWVVLWGLSRGIVAHLHIRWVVLKAVVVALLWLVAGILCSVVPILISGVPLPAVVGVGLQTLVIIIVFSIVFARRSVGNSIREHIEASNAELERREAENRIHVRNLRESLRRFVHADMQTALVAIEKNGGDILTERLHNILTGLIDSATYLDEKLPTSQAVGLAKIEKYLSGMWEGVLEVDLNWSPEVDTLLSTNSLTASVLEELLNEITTNSVKHGGAQGITIDVTLVEPLLLMIKATSVVAAQPPRATVDGGAPSSRGRGTELFDQVCASWRLETRGRLSVFTATVPLLGESQEIS